ncbi:MAG: hypothetical protein ACXVHQ_40710 [Solirubrobacteraceae bacterium]
MRCLIRGETIGTHELLLVIAPRSGRTTSLAREPLLGNGDEIITHRACGLQHRPQDDIDPSHADSSPPEL